MKQKNKEKLITSGLSAVIGGIYGTIDCIAFDLPILTAGLPIWETFKFLNAQSSIQDLNFPDNIKTTEYLSYLGKSLIPYTIGAGIPFAIKYNQEISEFLQKYFN